MVRLSNFQRYDFPGRWQMVTDRERIVSVEPDAGEGLDLEGKFVLPGFIDSHCHILPTGLDLQKLHLGHCETKEQVLDAVRDYEKTLEGGKWCLAVHYDQTKFPGAVHIHRAELDAISILRPILLRSVNGHASLANSAALQTAGITKGTPNPSGGEYVRDASGELTGVLLEDAHEFVTAKVPNPTLEEMVEAILVAGTKMRELGITCATDMMTGRFDLDLELQAYWIAAERGNQVRTRLFLQWGRVFGGRAISGERLEELSHAMNPDTCRVEGIKIFADGAIGSATAAIYGEFLTEPRSSGQLIYAPERLASMIKTADDAGYRIAIHSIGDRATDLVMDGYSHTLDAERHRIEHAMMLSDAQIQRMALLGCHCAMQPEFMRRFGHAYRAQLGDERAWKLKRMRSVLDAGIPLSLSSDRPIVAGDPWDGINSAVNRPEGFDPAESLTLTEAIRGYTEMGAIANGDPDSQAQIAPGFLADFNIVDALG